MPRCPMIVLGTSPLSCSVRRSTCPIVGAPIAESGFSPCAQMGRSSLDSSTVATRSVRWCSTGSRSSSTAARCIGRPPSNAAGRVHPLRTRSRVALVWNAADSAGYSAKYVSTTSASSPTPPSSPSSPKLATQRVGPAVAGSSAYSRPPGSTVTEGGRSSSSTLAGHSP